GGAIPPDCRRARRRPAEGSDRGEMFLWRSCCMQYSPSCIFIHSRFLLVKHQSPVFLCRMRSRRQNTAAALLDYDGSTARIALTRSRGSSPLAGSAQKQGAGRAQGTHSEKTTRIMPPAHPPDSRKFRDWLVGLRPSRGSATIQFRDLPSPVRSPRGAGLR